MPNDGKNKVNFIPMGAIIVYSFMKLGLVALVIALICVGIYYLIRFLINKSDNQDGHQTTRQTHDTQSTYRNEQTASGKATANYYSTQGDNNSAGSYSDTQKEYNREQVSSDKALDNHYGAAGSSHTTTQNHDMNTMKRGNDSCSDYTHRTNELKDLFKAGIIDKPEYDERMTNLRKELRR